MVKIFKETYDEFIDLRMNSSIEKFQASEISRQHQSHKSHQNVLEAAIVKIKELEKKSPVTGGALEQRTQAIQHILAGIDKIKNYERMITKLNWINY